MNTPMPRVEEALALARAGWEVLPLNGKVPTTAHGVLDATTDEARIRDWWRARDHNVGARVPEQLIVLDVDPQNGGAFAELEAITGEPLPATLTVHSGRNTGGQHRYFARPPGELTATRLPAGIDLKTHRGYCVMPPSLHPATGKPYRWEAAEPVPLPPATRALLQVRRRQPIRPTAPVTETRSLALAQFVSTRPEGQRNAGLFWAACRAVEDGHPQSTFDLLEGAALAAGLSEREIAQTIASARRRSGPRS
jgi:hypothetical protein